MRITHNRSWIRIIFNGLLIILAIITILIIWGIYEEVQLNKEPAMAWIKEESKFLSYSIEGNKVLFSYEFCFENYTEWDITIYSIGISLSKKQTQGWITHENQYGETSDKADPAVIPPMQKSYITVTFEGEYLGGEPSATNMRPEGITISWG